MQTIRHTPQRRLVLGTLKLSLRPLTADEVLTRVRRSARAVSLSTVYRNLDLLAERGEIFRLAGPDGVHRFAGAVQADASFVCQRCGVIEHVALPGALAWLESFVKPRPVSAASITVQGRCVDCERAEVRHAR